jgi:tRNA pseudouridine13 synthase
MKLKQQPEDFQVAELTDVNPSAGPFAFYRLEKRGWSTPDALQALRRRWHLDLGRVSYGGLKDRHAQTVQYLTIFRGPPHDLTHHKVQVHYLGQVPQPYTSKDIRANRFRVVLRSLAGNELAAAEQALSEVQCGGVPNYFDDQRFGSVEAGGEFMAHALVQGRFEDALRLALASPYEHDRGPQKREKELLRSHWGDWPRLKQQLPRGHARSLIDYLVGHPSDFRGAIARLRPDLRGLYLSAYQSHLWNRMLARWLEQHAQPEQLLAVQLRLGTVPMHRGLDAVVRDKLTALALPLPSARLKLEADDPRLASVQSVLAEEGLELKQMQVKGLRDVFFSKGERAALCIPAGLQFEAAVDEKNPGRHAMILSFELPRGAYATLIVKRITNRL